uniref:Uncharacterized protein n=1 Tax=Trypanosoma congolense (strain IL3000) TaxID=1068625 RepID=G0UMC1_TRYCI|nr:conserved hypothetical protein [Trypanosoma congolense IL3000]
MEVVDNSRRRAITDVSPPGVTAGLEVHSLYRSSSHPFDAARGTMNSADRGEAPSSVPFGDAEEAVGDAPIAADGGPATGAQPCAVHFVPPAVQQVAAPFGGSESVCGVCLEAPAEGCFVELLCCRNVLCAADAQVIGSCPFCRHVPLMWNITK